MTASGEGAETDSAAVGPTPTVVDRYSWRT